METSSKMRFFTVKIVYRFIRLFSNKIIDLELADSLTCIVVNTWKLKAN